MIFYSPQTAFRCPTHGQHGKWIESEIAVNEGIGQMILYRLCGLCVIQMLKQVGYTITEPETLKESDWILDELPEKN